MFPFPYPCPPPLPCLPARSHDHSAAPGSDECRVNCCGLSRVNMTLGICWLVTVSILLFSRDVSRVLIGVGVMLAHIIAVFMLRCQFSAYGYPLERNVVMPISQVGAWGRHAGIGHIHAPPLQMLGSHPHACAYTPSSSIWLAKAYVHRHLCAAHS